MKPGNTFSPLRNADSLASPRPLALFALSVGVSMLQLGCDSADGASPVMDSAVVGDGSVEADATDGADAQGANASDAGDPRTRVGKTCVGVGAAGPGAPPQALFRFLGEAQPSSTETDGDYQRHVFAHAKDGSTPGCLAGAPFWAATRQASSEDLLVYLAGGGACTRRICTVIEQPPSTVPTHGALNPDAPHNALRDFDTLYVPYCDGGFFWGDRENDTLDPPRSFRGLRNLSAALDVAATQFPSPRRVVLAGSSAGSYATLLASALVRRLYPDVDIDVVADAGLGLFTPGDPGWVDDALADWGATRLLPEGCVECTGDGHLTRLWDWALHADERLRVGALSSSRDVVIGSLFFQLPPEDYERAVYGETGCLAERHPGRYHRWVIEETAHTFIGVDTTTKSEDVEGFDGFDATAVLGRYDGTYASDVSAAEWVRRMVEDDGWADHLE